MTTLKAEILNALSTYGDSKIIDGNVNRAYSFKEILQEINELERSFEDVDFRQKVVVFDFHENSIDLVILLLFVLKKGGIPLIIELSGLSSEVTNKLLYYAIVRHKSSMLSVENNIQFTSRSTKYGTFLITNNLLNISSYRECTLLLTSSGTVGAKKIMKFESPGILSNIRSNIKALGITKRDTTLMCLPIYYSYSLIGQFFSHLLQGANIIIAPYRFVAFSIGRLIDQYKPTNFFTTPTQVNILLSNKLKKGALGLRFITVGGGYLNKFSFQRFSKKYPAEVYYKTYGITEAGPRVATYTVNYSDTVYFEPNYLGTPLNKVGMSLCEKMGNYDNHETGFLRITSPSIFKGYLLHKSEYDQQKDHLITEDIVYRKDGKVYILGRNTDRFHYEDKHLWRFEVEDTINEQFSGILKIKLKKDGQNFRLGIMKHPKSKVGFDQIHKALNQRFGSKFTKNLTIGKFNERFAFTK